MHNRFCGYSFNEKILYSKQFGFQKDYSKEHVTAELAVHFHESFENGNYSLGIFIDLSNAFDTIGHAILLKKL